MKRQPSTGTLPATASPNADGANAAYAHAFDALLALPPAECLDVMAAALARNCHDAMVAGCPWPDRLYLQVDRALTAAARTIGGAA